MKQNLEKEKEWHEQKFYVDSGHWTSHPLFASRERHWLQNCTQKMRFYGFLHRYIKKHCTNQNVKVLLAPVGDGSDLRYLQGYGPEIYGIDISEIAVGRCPKSINTKIADILDSDFYNETFDLVICSNFLHHVHNVGFEPFIREYKRVLRKGGIIAILEPCAWHPFRLIIKLMAVFLGNVSGKVDGERPVNPLQVVRQLRYEGFSDIRTIGITYNHARFPCFLQSFINIFDYLPRRILPFSLFSYSIGWYGIKQD